MQKSCQTSAMHVAFTFLGEDSPFVGKNSRQKSHHTAPFINQLNNFYTEKSSHHTKKIKRFTRVLAPAHVVLPRNI